MKKKQEYKCENCGKLFQNPQALGMHERWKTCQNQTHSNEERANNSPINENEASLVDEQKFQTSSSDEVVLADEKDGEELGPAEEPEELSLNDLGFNSTPEPVTEDLACSECGAKLTGNETQCPSCSEVFE